MTDLPTDALALRRLLTLRRRAPAERPHIPRPDLVRVLALCDPDLVRLAVAVNRGLAAQDSVSRITQRIVNAGTSARIDDNVVRLFMRAVHVDHLVTQANSSNFARYHARKRVESESIGKSAYTHRRGPARGPVEVLEDLDDDDFLNDFIRGQGGL